MEKHNKSVLRLQLGLILALLASMLCVGKGCLHAQVKIGEIEISMEVAKEYFLDCYLIPDTVTNRFESRGSVLNEEIMISDPMFGDKFNDLKIEAKRLENISLSKFRKDGDMRTYYVVPRIPTAQDFVKWMKRHEEA